MAQLKSNEIDTWLAKPRPPTPVVLVYGPDRGLVSERAHSYAALIGLPLDMSKVDGRCLDLLSGPESSCR